MLGWFGSRFVEGRRRQKSLVDGCWIRNESDHGAAKGLAHQFISGGAAEACAWIWQWLTSSQAMVTILQQVGEWLQMT